MTETFGLTIFDITNTVPVVVTIYIFGIMRNLAIAYDEEVSSPYRPLVVFLYALLFVEFSGLFVVVGSHVPVVVGGSPRLPFVLMVLHLAAVPVVLMEGCDILYSAIWRYAHRHAARHTAG